MEAEGNGGWVEVGRRVGKGATEGFGEAGINKGRMEWSVGSDWKSV